MLQIFQLTLLQVILERSSSEIHFRPGLKHQAEQMQHPANISRSIQDSSNKVEPTQNISTIDAYRRHLFFPKEGTTESMVIGDSITNRIDGMQIGPNVLAIGFGVIESQNCLGELQRTEQKK